MKDKFLQSIIKEKKTCYFISPHFDDAVLSAGSLMTYLSQHVPVVVVNVFTKASDYPYTLSGKTFLKQCGYDDPKKLFADREKEDGQVLASIKAKVINLGFADALWRKKKKQNFVARLFPKVAELQMVYPTYRFHIIKGKVARQDLETLSEIKKKLSEHISTENAVIFCPLGTGSHIDHVMTRKASEEQFPSVIYWSDFPYNEKTETSSNSSLSGGEPRVEVRFSFEGDLEKKRSLVEGYGTQYQAMFKNGMKLRPEVFFLRGEQYGK